jgi:hypothetical protein
LQRRTNVSDQNGQVWDDHERPRTVNVRETATGTVKTYTVVEMGDGPYSRYTASMAKRFVKDQDPDFVGMREDLIEKCLRTSEGGTVPRSVIEGWGQKLKSRVFAVCQEVNGLGDTEVNKSGKGPSGEPESGGGTESPANSA